MAWTVLRRDAEAHLQQDIKRKVGDKRAWGANVW